MFVDVDFVPSAHASGPITPLLFGFTSHVVMVVVVVAGCGKTNMHCNLQNKSFLCLVQLS